MNMDGRLLGLSIVIFAFAVVVASAQNFYPTRYGKRDNQAATDGRWSRGSQYDRRSDSSGIFFFGSRYGKRAFNATSPEALTQRSVPAASDRYGRSPDANNNERFFFGSRFGKRSSSGDSLESEDIQSEDSKDEYLVCRYTGFRHLYFCDTEKEGDQVVGKVL